MKLEVTICKHHLATGTIEGKFYTITVEDENTIDVEKCFNTAFDEALRQYGISSKDLHGITVLKIEDEDGMGLGYAQHCDAIDGIAYRITVLADMNDATLWDHSSLWTEEDM